MPSYSTDFFSFQPVRYYVSCKDGWLQAWIPDQKMHTEKNERKFAAELPARQTLRWKQGKHKKKSQRQREFSRLLLERKSDEMEPPSLRATCVNLVAIHYIFDLLKEVL